MKLTKTHHFYVRKALLSNYLNLPNYLNQSNSTTFSYPLSFIVSIQVRIFPLNMRNRIIYVARSWEKYFSKHSLVKHTCSWRDKLIALSQLFLENIKFDFGTINKEISPKKSWHVTSPSPLSWTKYQKSGKLYYSLENIPQNQETYKQTNKNRQRRKQRDKDIRT